jgi:hypothetical protein
MFFDDVVEHARQHIADPSKLTEDELAVLRDEETFQVAQFYYVAEKSGLNDREILRAFLYRHNDDLKAYLGDEDRLRALSLTKARVKDGLFSDQAIEKVCQLSEGKLRLDQTDLGRLLSPLKSPETVRKAVLALAKGGLLGRVRVGAVLLVSNGILEQYFAKHLRAIVDSLRGPSSSGRKKA